MKKPKRVRKKRPSPSGGAGGRTGAALQGKAAGARKAPVRRQAAKSPPPGSFAAAIIESSWDSIVSQDSKGIVTSWNRGAERLFGYTAKEMIGRPILEIIPEEKRDEERRILARIKTGAPVEHFETVRRAKRGRLIDVSLTVSPIRDARGKVVGASKVARDITERKRGEIALNRLASIIASSEDAIIGKNLDGIVTDWNQGAEKIFGYTAVEMVGTSIMRIIPADRKNEEDRILNQIKVGKRVGHFETVRMAKGGRLIDLSVTVSPIFSVDGKIVGASKVGRDITERKQQEESRRRVRSLTASNLKLEEEIARREILEKELDKSRRELEGLQEQTKRLAQQGLHAQETERRRISRELHDQVAQTLIGTNVRLASLLAEVETLSYPGVAHLHRQLSQIQELLENSVLTVHTLSQDLRPLLLDDLGLVTALRDVLKTFMADTGIRAHLAVSANVDDVDNEILTVLYRVIQEALNNVKRHSKARSVHLRIERLANRLSMTVIDDGVGCPEDPFVRAKKNKRLGLLGMRERLEMVGGTFEILCEDGKGTTVTAEVPLTSR